MQERVPSRLWQEYRSLDVETVQWVKGLAAKSPGTHTVEGKNWLSKVVL